MRDVSVFETHSQPFTVDNLLSINLSDYNKRNLTTFSSLTEIKSYTPITGCVLEHIITTTNLTNHEKLYYLLADSLALISKNNGYGRLCSLPSEDWAERLGCSRSLVFTMQNSLVKKGYFVINKDWDKIGRNKRNLIIPTLPASVFNHLNEKFPDRIGDHAYYKPLIECKRSYLDRTKLFIKLNYNLLKIITSNEYTNPRQKIMWLGFYTRCYKNYMIQGREDFNVGKYNHNDGSSFSFITSYKELADLYSCSTKHISKSIKTLEELGFIKTQNIYIRKNCSDNNDDIIQERQDQSLWNITLSLPDDCILKLEKVKDRSNLKLKDSESVVIDNIFNQNLVGDCLILSGIKFNLNSEQVSTLKSVILVNGNDSTGNNSTSSSIDFSSTKYIDSVMEELDTIDEPTELNTSAEVSLSDISFKNSPLEAFDSNEEKRSGIKSDPHVAKSGLLLNKYLISKIKDIKSNLGASHKVLFDEFLMRFREDENGRNVSGKKNRIRGNDEEFNIHSELIREKLKILPKDKADKARKFAYSLVSKKLATGYAAGLNKHELAKQLIHHAASWKPTKLGAISREKEIDTALSVAWKAVIAGTWQVPLELAKAEILQYEFRHYKRKYQESGVLSNEAKSLEVEVNKLLGSWCDLAGKITKGVKVSNKEEALDDWNNRLLGLEPGKPDILTRNIPSINHTSSEMLMNNDNTMLRQAIVGNCNNQLGQRLEQLKTFEQNSSKCHSVSESENNEIHQHLDYFVHYRDPETKCFNKRSVDLSHIPDEQKYLKVIPSDKDDYMKLETKGGTEYLVRLKELETNEQGDLVITLQPNSDRSFLQLSKKIENDIKSDSLDFYMSEMPRQDHKSEANIGMNYLPIKKNLQNIEPEVEFGSNNIDVLQNIKVNNGAVKIDSIIGNIFKNIKIQDE